MKRRDLLKSSVALSLSSALPFSRAMASDEKAPPLNPF